MTQFHIYENINDIEMEWKNAYEKNLLLTPFQSYDWNSLLQKKYRKSINLRLLYKVCYAIAFFGDEYIIVPLSVRKGTRKIYFLGQQEMSDYLDFIYTKGIDYPDFSEFIRLLSEFFYGYTFIFDRIRDKSRTNIIFRQLPNCEMIMQKPCYGIPVAKTGGEYFSSLGKSTRGGVKTRRNRLERDGKVLMIDIIHGCVTDEVAGEMLRIYRSRRESIGGYTFIQKMFALINKLIKRETIDVLSEAMISSPNVFSAIGRIDGTIAAFCTGFTHESFTIYLCRVAINPVYSWYSPGGLLICKTMELLSDEPDNNNKYKYFDLSRGEEPYKQQFGGELRLNSCYRIKF